MKYIALQICFSLIFCCTGTLVATDYCPIDWPLDGEDYSYAEGAFSETEGTPGGWTTVASISQDNCGDLCPDDNPSSTTYTETTGYEIEVCFEVEYGIGGAEGCATYGTENSSSITLSVTAGACSKKKKTAMYRKVPVKITVPVTITCVKTYSDPYCDPGSLPGSCTCTETETSVDNVTGSGHYKDYTTVSSNPKCDPSICCTCGT